MDAVTHLSSMFSSNEEGGQDVRFGVVDSGNY